MIRPCDQCGGTGVIPRSLESVGGRCPRCADMPTLPCTQGPTHVSFHLPFVLDGPLREVPHVLCGGRGEFKPDPDTVMRWCESHGCAVGRGSKPICPVAYILGTDVECDLGWVERPIRLQEVPE